MIEVKKVSDLEFSYAKILIFGESGSGKTYFASTYIPEKTLFINVRAESGMMTLRALGVDIDTISIDTYADMKEAITWVKANGGKYDLIYIDSLSQWQRNLENEIPEGNNKFAKWGTIKDYTKEVIDAFKALPFHVVFTCEIKKDKDENAGDIMYTPSLLGSSRDDIPYWFDEVYYFIRFQSKMSDPISYKALTSAAMKYPCKSRLRLPTMIDNPKLSEIINLTGFKKIDKEVQKKELETVEKKKTPISNTNLEVLRELLATKDVDIKKFLDYYKAPHIPGFPDDQNAGAINALRRCKDKKKEAK
jgi:hypothetical protein